MFSNPDMVRKHGYLPTYLGTAPVRTDSAPPSNEQKNECALNNPARQTSEQPIMARTGDLSLPTF